MSEQFPSSPESLHNRETNAEKHVQRLDSHHEKGRHARHEHAEKLEDIREAAKESAASNEHVKEELEKHTKPDDEQPLIINNELKAMAYQRTLRRIRGQLPRPVRTFSKLIHSPVVETASEIGSKTVARPSGILAGGITAFLGSSLFVWVTRHYGYEYNFLLFALLFVGGFFIGLLVELIYRVFSRKS